MKNTKETSMFPSPLPSTPTLHSWSTQPWTEILFHANHNQIFQYLSVCLEGAYIPGKMRSMHRLPGNKSHSHFKWSLKKWHSTELYYGPHTFTQKKRFTPSSSFLSGREWKYEEIYYVKKHIDWKQCCMTASAIITELNKIKCLPLKGIRREKKIKKALSTLITMSKFARDNISVLKVNANKCSFLQGSLEVCPHGELWLIAMWLSSENTSCDCVAGDVSCSHSWRAEKVADDESRRCFSITINLQEQQDGPLCCHAALRAWWWARPKQWCSLLPVLVHFAHPSFLLLVHSARPSFPVSILLISLFSFPVSTLLNPPSLCPPPAALLGWLLHRSRKKGGFLLYPHYLTANHSWPQSLLLTTTFCSFWFLVWPKYFPWSFLDQSWSGPRCICHINIKLHGIKWAVT